MNLHDFKNVPPLYRPAPFWSWNDKLFKEELERQIDEMSEKGWGGYFMHSRVGLITGYLSEDWFELTNACAEKAGETGTFAWLYDEDKWPSGYGGGRVSENPDYRSRALVLLEKGQEAENDEVFLTFSMGDIDYVVAGRVSSMGDMGFNGTSYVDLMNPEAVKSFISCTHEEYKKHCGQYFGKQIPGIFTDEPCFLMNGTYKVPVMPWSDYLPDFFEKRKGYSVFEHLKELFFDIDDYKKIRYDFFDSASALFLESYTKQYYNWCQENDLIMTGHFMAEDTLTYQTQWIGNAMPHYEFMHWPGIDKLERHTKQTITVKQVSSVSEQLGKERVLCEVFGCIGEQSSFRERKWLADWEAVLGVSFVNSHLSFYSMRGERKRDHPANLFYQQPWWSEEKGLSDYIGRLCEVAAYGKRETEILVIHTVGSAWSEYSPITKKDSAYDEPFSKLTNMLIEENLDFHYGDETIMKNHARIENGNIKVGEYEYTAVLVPPSLTLTKSTVKLLSEFKGELIFVHPFPTRVEGVIQNNIISSDAKRVTSIEKAVSILSDIFKKRIVTTDIVSGKNAKKLICCTRNGTNDKLMLFANTEEAREINSELIINEARTPYILDLAGGDILKIPYKRENDNVIINAKFYFGGSLALLFTDENIDSLPAPVITDTGVSFGENLSILAKGTAFEASLKEENVLPIHKVTLYLNKEKVLENQPIFKAWHRNFFKAEDGTPFVAEYSFNAEGNITGELFAVIECGQNLDKITINGERVNPLRGKGDKEIFDPRVNYKDVNYIKIPISGLVKKGRNVIQIEGIKMNNVTNPGCHLPVKDFNNYASTEVDTVYIIGDFSVEGRDNSDFYITEKKKLSHEDITKSGAPFYAGKVDINCSLQVTAGKYIRLTGVNASYAKVFIGDVELKARYLMPYIFEIPENIELKNEIKIEIAGTLFNLTGPGWIDGILGDRGVGPGTFINDERYTEKYSFVPLGLQAVEIIDYNNQFSL